MRMIPERCENNDTKARYITSYNGDDINDYYLNRNRHLQNDANTSTQAPPQAKHGKSEIENALDNWNRGKIDKTAFPVLRDNNHYLTWNEEFTAEIRVQKMAKLIDKRYRRDQVYRILHCRVLVWRLIVSDLTRDLNPNES